jgi:flagellar basal body-associated protein FliL
MRKFKSGKSKNLAICVMLLILALVLCSCMKMHIDIVWNEDNSGTVSKIIAIKKGTLAMMDSSEEEIRAQFREGVENDADGNYEFNVENYTDSDYTGIKATIKVKDMTTVSPAITDLKFRCDGDGKNKTYTVSGAYSDAEITGGSSDLEGIEIDMKVSIVMPGKVVSHNATEQKGNKLTWDMTNSAIANIQATSQPGGGSLLWLWIVIIVVVVAGGVIVFLMLSRKKKANQQPPQYDPALNNAYGAPTQGYAPYQGAVAPPPQYTPPPQQYAPPPPPPINMKICTNCGAQIAEGSRFCKSCGTPVA